VSSQALLRWGSSIPSSQWPAFVAGPLAQHPASEALDGLGIGRRTLRSDLLERLEKHPAGPGIETLVMELVTLEARRLRSGISKPKKFWADLFRKLSHSTAPPSLEESSSKRGRGTRDQRNSRLRWASEPMHPASPALRHLHRAPLLTDLFHCVVDAKKASSVKMLATEWNDVFSSAAQLVMACLPDGPVPDVARAKVAQDTLLATVARCEQDIASGSSEVPSSRDIGVVVLALSVSGLFSEAHRALMGVAKMEALRAYQAVADTSDRRRGRGTHVLRDVEVQIPERVWRGLLKGLAERGMVEEVETTVAHMATGTSLGWKEVGITRELIQGALRMEDVEAGRAAVHIRPMRVTPFVREFQALAYTQSQRWEEAMGVMDCLASEGGDSAALQEAWRRLLAGMVAHGRFHEAAETFRTLLERSDSRPCISTASVGEALWLQRMRASDSARDAEGVLFEMAQRSPTVPRACWASLMDRYKAEGNHTACRAIIDRMKAGVVCWGSHSTSVNGVSAPVGPREVRTEPVAPSLAFARRATSRHAA
jgi:hypothetical protein